MTLESLKAGQEAYIISIGGERIVRRRLLDMGLTPGVEVKLIKKAPMGDPIEITLRGYSLTLRISEAKSIGVRLKSK